MTNSIARKISQFSKQEIDYAFEHARRLIKMPSIIILAAPQQYIYGKILIIASRKVGKAVMRNKLRRRIKSIFYEEKIYTIGYNFICIARPGATELDFETLKTLFINAKNQCVSSHSL